jgi:polyhydroxyalkanoate synthesis regulator phasin
MDILRKALLMGIGALSLTREKAEQITDDLVKRGEIASTERHRTIDVLLRETERQEKELQKRINAGVQNALSDIGVPTRKDFEEIKDMLRQIQLKMSFTEQKDIQ